MAKKKVARAKKGEGRLFIRTKSKKDYPAKTPGTEGDYWLAYHEPTGATTADGKLIKKLKRIKLPVLQNRLSVKINPISSFGKSIPRRTRLAIQRTGRCISINRGQHHD